MALTITGRLHVVGPIEYIKENFTKREFVIELVDESPSGMVFTNYAAFQLVNNGCSYIDNYLPGQMITVYFTIRGNKWERDDQVKYITTLSAWRLEVAAGHGSVQPAPPSPQTQQAPASYSNTGSPASSGFGGNTNADNDLPF